MLKKIGFIVGLLALAALGARPASASVAMSSATVAGGNAAKWIAAPGVSGQASYIDGCILSSSQAAACVTVAGSNTLVDPSFTLCVAAAGTTSTTGNGRSEGTYAPAQGGLTATLNNMFVSTGSWTATGSITSASVYLTCGYHYGSLK